MKNGFLSRFFTWLLLSGLLFCLSILQPLGIFGDGLEYIVQTQSFVFDRSISIDLELRANYWNQTNPFGEVLTPPDTGLARGAELTLKESSQSGGGFGSLYPSKQGVYFYVHSWVYSLACAPVYLTLHLLAENQEIFPSHLEYRSFGLLNSLLFAAALVLSIRSFFGLLAAVLLLCSPLGGYISWSTPEVFQFSLLAIAFSSLIRRSKFVSPLLVGIAGAQNFPALVFLLPLLLFQIPSQVSPPKSNPLRVIVIKFARLSSAYLIALIVGICPWLLYQLNFLTPNLIVYLGQASIKYCSLLRFESFLLSPLVGVLWFFPLYFLLLPSLFFFHKRQPTIERLAICLLVILTFVICYSMTGMANFHSQQLGCVRYAAWIFAPIAGLLLSELPTKSRIVASVRLLGVLLSLVIVYFYHNNLFILARHSRTNYLSTTPEQALRLYRTFDFNEDPEVLFEIVLQKEIISPWEFDSRYEIPLKNGQALCLVSLRSTTNGKVGFLPKESLCNSLVIPPVESTLWQRSPVLGGYYLHKMAGS